MRINVAAKARPAVFRRVSRLRYLAYRATSRDVATAAESASHRDGTVVTLVALACVANEDPVRCHFAAMRTYPVIFIDAKLGGYR